MQQLYVILLFIVNSLRFTFGSVAHGCDLNINGASSQGEIAFIQPNVITADNVLQCTCVNQTALIEFILPDGTVAMDNSEITVTSSPGTVSISPPSGQTLPEGVYTCKANDGEEAKLHAYILDPNDLSTATSSMTCGVKSLDPVTRAFTAEFQGLVPDDLNCNLDGVAINFNPKYIVLNRTRPTETFLSIPFTPNGDGTLECTYTSHGGMVLGTIQCTFSSTMIPSVPATPISDTPQVGLGANSLDSSPIITVNSISETNPLWCHGPDNSSASWILPNGEIIDGSTPSSEVSFVTSDSGIGLYPAVSSDFPQGIYMCIVDGQSVVVEVTDSVTFPAIEGQECILMGNPSTLTLSVNTSGLISSITCVPVADTTSMNVLMSSTPLLVMTSAMFNMVTSGTTYTCTLENAGGQSSISCTVLSNPTGFTATRNPSNPSTVDFSWQPQSSPTTGYTITITSSDGMVVQTVPVSPETTSTTSVTNLDPDMEFTATITAEGSPGTTVTSPTTESDNVVIAPVDSATTEMCMPATGHNTEVCLSRPLAEGEDDPTCVCTNSSDSFVSTVFNNILQSSCIDTAECSSPMFSFTDATCNCKSDKKNTRDKTSTQKSKKSKKGRTKEKTKEYSVKVCVEAKLLCGSCEAAATTVTNRKRREVPVLHKINYHLRMRKSPRSKATGTNVDCIDTVTYGGTDYTVTGFKVERGRGRGTRNRNNYYCGDTQVTVSDTCDCPSSCSQ